MISAGYRVAMEGINAPMRLLIGYRERRADLCQPVDSRQDPLAHGLLV